MTTDAPDAGHGDGSPLGETGALWLDEPGPPLIRSQGETEDELETHDADEFEAAVSSSDWTVETVVNQMRKGRIDLNPRFQRRNAWLDERKSQLIESVILRYPIPQLVLAEAPGRQGNYLVIDGKQRLLALRQFCVDEDEAADVGFEPLTLSGLDILDSLNGLTWRGVQRQRPDLAAKFENHTIRTVFLSHWKSDDLLLSLFLRLNTGSVTLSPQELRQALIPGDFVDWVDEASGASTGLRRLLGNAQPDRRMIDAELLLRFISFRQLEFPYRGNLKRFLDDTCRLFNDRWADSRATLDSELYELEAGIDAVYRVFGRHACRKWNTNGYERPFNRALFDIQVGAFANPTVRDALDETTAARIEAGFRYLCDFDPAFVLATTTSTKTSEAFRTRFNAWRDVIREATGLTFDLPRALAR